jgi:hypothetical protein
LTNAGNCSFEVNGIKSHCKPHIISAVQYSLLIILRGRCYDIIVLNVHAPKEDKNDDKEDRLHEEQEQVFDKFLKYRMNILLADFNAKVGKEIIFKPTIGYESLHENSNNNGIRVVKFATSKNLTVKNMMFP